MSPLRIIGYVGLALLSVIVLLSIYLSFGKGDWYGVGIGLGALVLFAFLGNGLWLAGFKEKRPYVSIVPNQTISTFLFAVLGIFMSTVSIERFLVGSWLAATIALVMAICLFEETYRLVTKT